MAQTKQRSTKANTGGRTAAAVPKVQVFKEFTGINFEESDNFQSGYSIDTPHHGQDQTDLRMDYLFLQNNVFTTSNKTFQTRDSLVTLFHSPDGVTFTGPAKLIGPKLYIAKSDTNIGIADLNARAAETHSLPVNSNTTLDNLTSTAHHWSSLEYYDDKLIAMTEENELWTGDIASYNSPPASLRNAKLVPNPSALAFSSLSAKGDLSIAQAYSDSTPHRISISYTYVNRFGPTVVSNNLVFYANHPPLEWSASRYLVISANFPSNFAQYEVLGVELYYTTNDAISPIFLGRTDVAANATSWSYTWYGYVDATSQWAKASLLRPTENYTQGVHASQVTEIDGRLYFWGDSTNANRLYVGGNPGNLFSISPGTGGGFVDVEPGTSQEIKHVCKYKTQSGNSIVTLLCTSPNTRQEQRYNLVENTISVSNEQSMRSWQAEQVAGAVGCKSPHGAIVCQDGLYSISRYGLALTTMTMEYNSQVRTTYVSDPIKPIFTDVVDAESRLGNAIVLELDGIIYMALGANSDQTGAVDNVLFCYDIDLKAWWTYTLDIDVPILNLIHIDWQGQREGIGIITANNVYLLPTTVSDDTSDIPLQRFLIQTAKLSTVMPRQNWQWLSQLEFHFDRFVGDATITVKMTDMFGRELTITKSLHETDQVYDLITYMRIDQRVMSYSITITGKASFRLTHWMAKVYTYPNNVGIVWGFDDAIAHRSAGSVHPTFKDYNDVRRALFT